MPKPDANHVIKVFEEKLGNHAPAFVKGPLQATVSQLVSEATTGLPEELIDRHRWLEEARVKLHRDTLSAIDRNRVHIRALQEELSDLEALRSTLEACGLGNEVSDG